MKKITLLLTLFSLSATAQSLDDYVPVYIDFALHPYWQSFPDAPFRLFNFNEDVYHRYKLQNNTFNADLDFTGDGMITETGGEIEIIRNSSPLEEFPVWPTASTLTWWYNNVYTASPQTIANPEDSPCGGQSWQPPYYMVEFYSTHAVVSTMTYPGCQWRIVYIK